MTGDENDDSGTPGPKALKRLPQELAEQVDAFEATGSDIDSATLAAPVASRPATRAEDVRQSEMVALWNAARAEGASAEPPKAAAADDPDDDAELTADELLHDVYRVIRKLGSGGMGAVYEVEHVRMKKRYAAKVLRREFSAQPEYVRRLEREAVASSRIEHPNIVQVVNFGETPDGQVYLVMELLEGCDLSQQLQGGPLEIAEVFTLGIQVADALQAAHDEGIVHRDLKPENLFLSRLRKGGTTMKVVDFGISKAATGDESVRLTRTGYVLGTPLYMSPEHAQGGAAVDSRGDIYSLGVILYETLIGAPPFTGTKPLEVMLKHVSQVVPAVSERRRGVPKALDEIIAKALQKDREDRYQTMGELSQALREAAEALGLSGAPLPGASEGASRAIQSVTPGPVVSTQGELTEGHRKPPWPLVAAAVPLVAAAAVAVAVALTWVAGSQLRHDGPAKTSAAAPATVAPVAAPAAPRPVEPARVTLRFESTPAGASVEWNGRLLGTTPLDATIPRGDVVQEFALAKTGYLKALVSATPDGPRTLQVALQRPAPEPAAASPPPVAAPPKAKRRPAKPAQEARGFRDRR